MPDEINWTLEELVTLYHLHPELRDMFVEGDSDQGFLQWFTTAQGCHDVAIYPVSVVEIPEEKILAYGLEYPDNRRSEVIALALEVERECTDQIRATFIADADAARIGMDSFRGSLLFFTDYTSIEMYAFKVGVIEKLLRITRPRLKLSGREVLEAITPILQTLFALRMANKDLRWGLSWLSFERCAKLRSGRVTFDLKEYIARYLNTGGKRKELAEFNQKLEEIRRKFTDDPRNQIRGHDFVDVLAWFLLKSGKGSDNIDPDTLSRMLMIQLTPEELRAEPLFQVILNRAGDQPVSTP